MEKFDFKKKFGQNFLSDKNLLSQIVERAGVCSDDIVVEIGAGKGALTEELSKRAKKVYSFEIDRELFSYLSEKFENSNVEFIFEDVMKFDDEKLNQIVGGKFKLVANLPYYVTSPIISRFIKNENLISLSVMVQEEVADRIIAQPKMKDYGVLTIICQSFGEAKKVLRVGRQMFYPVPNVDSAVVRIDKKESHIENFEGFIEFVKKAFSMRRKKISTNLANEKLSKTEVEEILLSLGYLSSVRAEELSILELEKLYNQISCKN